MIRASRFNLVEKLLDDMSEQAANWWRRGQTPAGTASKGLCKDDGIDTASLQRVDRIDLVRPQTIIIHHHQIG